jgi:hypothetical protein
MIWELSQDLNNQYSLVSCICKVFGPLEVQDQYAAADVKLYPNPVNGLITITSKKRISDFYMYDLQGRMVYQNKMKALNTTIDLSGFSSGIYFLKLKFDEREIHYKIIKYGDL